MDSEIKKIKSRSLISAGSLLLNSSYAAALGFVSFFILTLKSDIFLLGIYNTVLAMMSFFNYFTNLGLAAAIVQKKDTNETDLSTAFYIQFFLSSIAVIIGFLFTDKLFSIYKDLPPNAIPLYWSILFSFFLISFRTIPSVLLEKKIEIYKVVFVQALENTVFYLSVIVLSLMGWDIMSLVVAVMLRSVVGTIAIYVLNPWFPKLLFSFSSAKALLKYGIPFQGNSFLALVKDDLLIIYLGSAIGLRNLGYVTFGKKYAEFSIRLIADNLNRVAFPLFSKLQKNKDELKKSLEQVLFYELLLILPMIVGAIFVFDSLLKIIPGYFVKWNLSLFSFYFFSLSALFISMTSPFVNVFNALGKVKISLYFMVLWTALTWLLIPIFIKFIGYNGISVSFFIMSLTFIFVIAVARKHVKFSFGDSFKIPLTASFIMALYLLVTRIVFLHYISNVYLHIVTSVAGSVLIYFTLVTKMAGTTIYTKILNLLKKNG